MTCPRVPALTSRGVRAACCASTQGAQKNWMTVKGMMMSMRKPPDNSTTMEKARPRSVVNVMSPNPSVDMTVRDQYTPVKAEYSRPSKPMSQ